MNGASLTELRMGVTRESPDEKMDQIRELLIGDYVRHSEAQIAALNLRVQELESLLRRQVETLSARIDAIAQQGLADRRDAFDELSKGVTDLAERIRRASRET